MLASALVLTLPAPPASAKARPITPEYFGVQDDGAGVPDDLAWSTGRVWAAWCTIQPTRETEVADAAQRRLGPTFAMYAGTATTRLTVSLGHPSPWVFDNHRLAVSSKGVRVWYCEYAAANTSFPTVRTLRSEPVKSAYADYVRAVIDAARPYLDANAENTLVLQAWNEPNLLNGGTITNRIPGAARSWKAASASLREQERIMRRVATELIPGRFEVTSPSLYGKKTALGTRYFKDQAKRRTIDSISLNFYTLRQGTVNKSLARWRTRAGVAKRLVTKHKRLRKVPIYLTETNHNLVNHQGDYGNLTTRWAAPAAQQRMVEVTTMEAIRRGFAGIQWYQGTPTQTAVDTRPGTVATEAGKALRAELVGRRLVKCRTKKSRTTCTFSARPDSGRIKVSWSSKGSRGVTISR